MQKLMKMMMNWKHLRSSEIVNLNNEFAE